MTLQFLPSRMLLAAKVSPDESNAWTGGTNVTAPKRCSQQNVLIVKAHVASAMHRGLDDFLKQVKILVSPSSVTALAGPSSDGGAES